MSYLSHWDFAEQFSGYEAAALMLGLEPAESSDDQWRVRIVTERMELHYNNALSRLRWEKDGFSELLGSDRNPPKTHPPLDKDFKPDPEAGWPVELESAEMELLHRRSFLYGEETPFIEWLGDKRRNNFDNQRFNRYRIVLWLKAIKMKSSYAFDQPDPEAAIAKASPPAHTRWPWGNHHTQELGHLEAAAKEFWTTYDPEKPSSAPKNVVVSNWLQARGVTKDKADAIASILRADGLPTGPRK